MKVEDAIYDLVIKNPGISKEEISDKFLGMVFDTTDEELRSDFYKRCGIYNKKITDSLR